ncbi:PP2C family protein-serine/threonine phosphatase [Celeribacter litoreus]|uniref:PP2C family protein-serine/threonine phosphatase n=1 Tax=Celeribacter litoreus TaxID=2876714 RepID=UPI001CCBBE2C|nr:SpoIIE family protein phosphatase [Celeribacter litoreus]MCA0042124.1 SpoIIE family protein phosphatase [Celeribacter litoreus]
MAVARETYGYLEPSPERGVIDTVLVADDSRSQRRILSSYLKRWGYHVFEAGSGEEALDICKHESIDLIVSDWMMPGMNGLEFCAAFRALERTQYSYFILLTSKSDKAAVAQGLDIGADDFLTKPVAANELLARIRAGERILRMERELTAKNRLVNTTLAEISELYDSLDRDLLEARKLQQSLVRDRFRDFGAAQVALLLRPSGHVGGDLVGFFPINMHQFGIFSIDVSGHGVASALMTARLAANLTGSTPDQNVALRFSADGKAHEPVPPSEVAAILNTIMLTEMDTDLYFTMVLAHFDMVTGEFVMSQCGHPNPILQNNAGEFEFLGDGGLPIGLLPDAHFEEVRYKLEPGERVFVFSDGVTECPDGRGDILGDKGLIQLLQNSTDQTGKAFFDTFIWDLADATGERDFPDDISAILLEMHDQKIE